jgi:hypothetical protein
MPSRSLGPDSSKTFFLALCISAGVVLAIGGTPNLLLHLPTELSRTTEMVRALRKAPGNLALVVTGDSVMMNGVNTKLLGEEMRPPCEAWNLATVGQGIAETLFVADMLPRSVRTLGVGLLPDGLSEPTVTLPEDRYLFYRLSGYQPTAEALAVARQLPSQTLYNLMSEPQWRATLSGRGMIRISADLTIRSRLRPDLDIERARTDLYFPAPYRKRISEAALAHAVGVVYQPQASFNASAQRLQFLLLVREMLARRGQRLIIVIMPQHPRAIAMNSAAYYAQFSQYEDRLRNQFHFDLNDFHGQLGESDFVDQIHPGGTGSERLTKMMAASLTAQRASS